MMGASGMPAHRSSSRIHGEIWPSTWHAGCWSREGTPYALLRTPSRLPKLRRRFPARRRCRARFEPLARLHGRVPPVRRDDPGGGRARDRSEHAVSRRRDSGELRRAAVAYLMARALRPGWAVQCRTVAADPGHAGATRARRRGALLCGLTARSAQPVAFSWTQDCVSGAVGRHADADKVAASGVER
jgi:hypothetical protein